MFPLPTGSVLYSDFLYNHKCEKVSDTQNSRRNNKSSYDRKKFTGQNGLFYFRSHSHDTNYTIYFNFYKKVFRLEKRNSCRLGSMQFNMQDCMSSFSGQNDKSLRMFEFVSVHTFVENAS